MLTSSPFKPPCPLCRTGIGRAISIGMMGQERTITYLCAECGHKWKATDVVPRIPFAVEPELEGT
jgi:hypothetical protein